MLLQDVTMRVFFRKKKSGSVQACFFYDDPWDGIVSAGTPGLTTGYAVGCQQDAPE